MTGLDLGKLSFPIAIYIFIAGMIAISAMFLPGISGSTLLLIFGLYLPVISGIKELLHMNFSAFPALSVSTFSIIAFIIGIVIVEGLQFMGSRKSVVK